MPSEKALIALLGKDTGGLFGFDRRAAQGGLDGGACAVEQARSLSEAIRYFWADGILLH